MDNEQNVNNNGTSNGVAIAGMVVGIVSIPFMAVPILPVALGIVGIILGIVGVNKSKVLPEWKGKGFGIAGIITGSIGTVLGLIYTIMWIVLIITAKAIVDESGNELNKYNSYKNFNVTVKYSAVTEYENTTTTLLDTTYKA